MIKCLPYVYVDYKLKGDIVLESYPLVLGFKSSPKCSFVCSYM